MSSSCILYLKPTWRSASTGRSDHAINFCCWLSARRKQSKDRRESSIDNNKWLSNRRRKSKDSSEPSIDNREDMAAMQVENICLLGENTALKKRKREDGSNATCSQWVRHLRTTCPCQVLDCRQIRRLFPVHMHRKELTQCFSYVQHQDRGLARLDYLFCLDRSSWRLFLCLLRFPAFASGCVKINVSKFVLYFFFNYGRRACGLEPDSGRSRPGWRRTFFFPFSFGKKNNLIVFFCGQVLSARQNGGGGCLVRASPAAPAARLVSKLFVFKLSFYFGCCF